MITNEQNVFTTFTSTFTSREKRNKTKQIKKINMQTKMINGIEEIEKKVMFKENVIAYF